MMPFLTFVLNSWELTELRVPFERAIASSMICAVCPW